MEMMKCGKKPGFMRLSELDPRVESPSLLPLFSRTLDPGGKFKNPGFMRVLATLDPLEYSSGPYTGKRELSPSLTITTDGKVFLTQKKG